ncbi:hypothetical protein M501DRAFT_989341 [Patellaria atrata CBS 101060]|uniref:Uncharacterized protein n=1 Tax=Patellaria atrata CBS 101060 TaxID=1346257 RepID=A0A9P4VJA1_9PEZI|nr:hypothetical protein M501DRAFT_989341 [Patellaria atrata CBS 101060]
MLNDMIRWTVSLMALASLYSVEAQKFRSEWSNSTSTNPTLTSSLDPIATSDGSSSGCGPCNLTAILAGHVWYPTIFNYTVATLYVVIDGTGNTTSTVTSLYQYPNVSEIRSSVIDYASSNHVQSFELMDNPWTVTEDWYFGAGEFTLEVTYDYQFHPPNAPATLTVCARSAFTTSHRPLVTYSVDPISASNFITTQTIVNTFTNYDIDHSTYYISTTWYLETRYKSFPTSVYADYPGLRSCRMKGVGIPTSKAWMQSLTETSTIRKTRAGLGPTQRPRPAAGKEDSSEQDTPGPTSSQQTPLPPITRTRNRPAQQTRPVDTEPDHNPPNDSSPDSQTPPDDGPPDQNPPIENFPDQNSPTNNPPDQNPPTDDSSGQNSPTDNSPDENPPNGGPILPRPPITVGTTTLTADTSGNFIVGTRTLRPGGAAATIGGTRISLVSDGNAVVVGTSTKPFLTPLTSAPTDMPPIILPVGDTTFTLFPGPSSTSGASLIVDSQFLIPGGRPITVSGTQVSLAFDGRALIVGTSIIPLTAPAITPAVTPASELVIDSTTLAPGPSGVLVIANGLTSTLDAGESVILASQTFTAGGNAVTVDGTIISIAEGENGMETVYYGVLTTGTEGVTDTPSTARVMRTTTVVVGSGSRGEQVTGGPTRTGVSGVIIATTTTTGSSCRNGVSSWSLLSLLDLWYWAFWIGKHGIYHGTDGK